MHDGAAWSVPAPLDGEVAALAAYGAAWSSPAGSSTGRARPAPRRHLDRRGLADLRAGPSYDPYGDGQVFALVATEAGVYAGGYFDWSGPCGSARRRNGGTAPGTTWPAACSRRTPSARSRHARRRRRPVRDRPVRDGRRRRQPRTARDGRHRWSPLGSVIQGMGSRPPAAAASTSARLLPGRRRACLQRRLLGPGDGHDAVGSAPVYDGNVLALAMRSTTGTSWSAGTSASSTRPLPGQRPQQHRPLRRTRPGASESVGGVLPAAGRHPHLDAGGGPRAAGARQ